MNSAATKKIKVVSKARRKRREWFIGFAFALPVILGVLIFTFYPAVQSFFYSFTDYDFFNGDDLNFVGFDNYVYMFTVDPEIGKVFGNTLLYAVLSVPFGLIIGYLLALVANFKVKGVSIYRTLFYLPVIIPSVASGLLFLDILGGDSFGIINHLLGLIGIKHNLSFFSSEYTALASLIFMGSWSAGGSMIIWLSAFKNISPELYEAAKIDGASSFKRLIKITIPMSTPMIFYNLVTGMIGALQITSTLIIGGTEGRGVEDSLYFVSIKIYNEAFGGGFNMAYASAISWVLFAIIGFFTLLTFKSSKWVFYGE